MSSRRHFHQLIILSMMLAVVAALVHQVSADNRQREAAALAHETLTRRCFACHGANGVAQKNVFVLDRNRLVTNRIVIPGDSNSLLLKMVESGAMPMGGPELSTAESGALRNWILGGAPDWDDEVITAKRIFLTEPAILALIRNDLLQTRERDRVFFRYLSLTHLFNAGVPNEEVAAPRIAQEILKEIESARQGSTDLKSRTKKIERSRLRGKGY